MIASNPVNPKLIRLRFLGLYALSIACIVLICMALFRKVLPAPPQKTVTVFLPAPTPAPVVAAPLPQQQAPPPTIVVQPDPAVDELRNSIREKDKRIAQLNDELKQRRNTNTAAPVPAKYEYKPAKGETIEALKQSNINLQLGFKDVMNKLWASYRSYNLLKKENEQLRKQLAQPH
jgi:hypothetical protein